MNTLVGLFIGWFLTWLWYEEKETIRAERELDQAFDSLLTTLKQ